jgi:hypothetical protein
MSGYDYLTYPYESSPHELFDKAFYNSIKDNKGPSKTIVEHTINGIQFTLELRSSMAGKEAVPPGLYPASTLVELIRCFPAANCDGLSKR